MGAVVQINVNPLGGVPKHPVQEAFFAIGGVEGDKQKHRRFHGGPSRAVCLYTLEHISKLQSEGHPIFPGSTGENLTVTGLEWLLLKAGSRLRVGKEVVLEITSHAAPCKQIAGSFADGAFERLSERRYPGWSRLYAKVLVEGVVRKGDAVICETPRAEDAP